MNWLTLSLVLEYYIDPALSEKNPAITAPYIQQKLKAILKYYHDIFQVKKGLKF